MIEFFEKNVWTDRSPFTGQTYAPNFMVKDGVEYFVANRVVVGEHNDKELQAIKQFLIQNEGTYFKFFGIYTDPFDMLKEMSDMGHTFCKPERLLDDCRGIMGYGAGFVDFHGNRNEVSAAFHYRIYDMGMVKRLTETLKPFLPSHSKEAENP